MSIKRVILPDTVLYKCREFAEKCVITNIDAYKRRNQSNPDKIIEQIITGKLGEFAVAEILGFGEPDLQIYEAKNKSYAADLVGEGKDIHVKAQTRDSAGKYGTSWSFSTWDSLITKPKPIDFIGLCVVDGPEVDFYGLFQMDTVKQLLREPVLYQLRASKRVLYWEDLLKFGENQPIK